MAKKHNPRRDEEPDTPSGPSWLDHDPFLEQANRPGEKRTANRIAQDYSDAKNAENDARIARRGKMKARVAAGKERRQTGKDDRPAGPLSLTQPAYNRREGQTKPMNDTESEVTVGTGRTVAGDPNFPPQNTPMAAGEPGIDIRSGGPMQPRNVTRSMRNWAAAQGAHGARR